MSQSIFFVILLAFFSCEKKEITGVDAARQMDQCSEKLNPSGSCVAVYDPVCGCNGVSYPNSCEAIRYGISNFVAGSCKK